MAVTAVTRSGVHCHSTDAQAKIWRVHGMETVVLADYLEKYPVFVRTFKPACFGRITIFRNVSSLPEFVG